MPEITHLPELYKRTATGAVEVWKCAFSKDDVAGYIHLSHGQHGGKMQDSTETISKGKNAGRANATTPQQQAELEARARWRKKNEREGYVTELSRAQAGDTDAEGGIAPMLAQPEDKGIKKVVYPAHVQRKFNGNRCISVLDLDRVEASLWSRKRKRIKSLPHIEAAYLSAIRAGVFAHLESPVVLDGEIYRHGWSLQKISGFCRTDDPKPGHEELQHHVYDLPSDSGSETHRRARLEGIFAVLDAAPKGPDFPIVRVETLLVDSYAAVKAFHDEVAIPEGYEGAIVRNLHGTYEAGKRSYNLVKVKEFHELEVEIRDVVEGRGKFAGKAIFKCVTAKGAPVDCSAPGTMEDRADFFANRDKLVGKMLTIKFFEYSDDGVPLFPVGLVVRDYE